MRIEISSMPAHVVHFQPLDRLPVLVQFFGHVLDRATATAPTLDAPNLEIEVDAVIGTGQIPDPTGSAVVPRAVRRTALATDRFFPRRTRVMRRARGSPNSPCTRASGRKPGKVYASARRRCLGDWAIRTSCRASPPSQHRPNPVEIGLAPSPGLSFHPHEVTKTLKRRSTCGQFHGSPSLHVE